MNKENLRDLLDNVLELEALIQLALVRDDCSEALLRLIDRKKMTLASAKEIATEETEKSLPDATPETDIAVEDESVTYTYDDSDFENESSLPDTEYSVEYKTDLKEYNTDLKETDREETEGDKHDEDVEEKTVKAKGRLVFSLNDRYRFKKELFDSSDAEFNTTLAFVASMDNYEEAEEYFIDELGWDKGNGVVAEFLEILKKYFN